MRICQHCGNEFTARTTVTKYCGDVCAKRAYKDRERADKVESSHRETVQTLSLPIAELKVKEFLTVPQLARLINCSRRTAYRFIQEGKIKSVNLGQRKTLVKRSELDKLFE